MIRKEMLGDEKVYERFYTEINNLEKLSHPGIARYIEDDLTTDVPYLAIEYVEGNTLGQHINEFGPLSENDWLEVFLKLATALKYCHSQGIIHKDISPENIILSQSGPIIIDFGISYLQGDPRVTGVDEAVGTSSYMSPEHMTGSVSAAMDVFSLASTFVFAATGIPTFSGESVAQIQFATTYLKPNLEKLTKKQKTLIIPMLYKKSQNRPLLTEAIDFASSELEAQEATNFNTFLKGSEKKLVQSPPNSKKGYPSFKLLASGSLVAALLVTAFVFLLSSNGQPSKKTELKSNLSPQIAALNQEADSLFFEKKFKAAYSVAVQSASQGNASGMVLAGKSAEYLGDIKNALIWYKKSCARNYSGGCFNTGNLLIDQKKYAQAVLFFKKSARLGDARGFVNLAIYYRDKGDRDLAITYFKRAGSLNELSALTSLGSLYEEEGNIKEALGLYIEASARAYAPGSMYAGWIYKSLKNYDSAKKYFELAISQAEPMGNDALGQVLLIQNKFKEAEKYFLAGAELGEPFAGNSLTSLYGNELKKPTKACDWAKRIVNFKDIDQDNLKIAKNNVASYCAVTKNPASKISPSASPTVSKSPSVSPILSSEKFTVSPPLASSVVTTSIWGRIFKDSLNYWRVILTNSKSDPVPPITGVQFRLLGYPDAGWMGVPYKLKVEPLDSSVYAEIDDLMFAILFKNSTYCPEFRAVREENGKIVKIWEKTKPECATNYTP